MTRKSANCANTMKPLSTRPLRRVARRSRREQSLDEELIGPVGRERQRDAAESPAQNV